MALSVAACVKEVINRSPFIAEMMPRPPPLDTAAAREASATQAIPPWNIGYSIPNMSQILLLIISFRFGWFNTFLQFHYGCPGDEPGPECAQGEHVPFLDCTVPPAFVEEYRAARR